MFVKRFVAAFAVGCALVAPAQALAHGGRDAFDLQAHRGGLGLVTENTLESFANGLEVGVSTLELDVQITEDQQVVVTHDRQVSAQKCRDTAPAAAGDPEYPYVGKYVKDLTLAQVRTLACDKPLAAFPDQRVVPEAELPLLREVFALVDCYGARNVKLNVETKVEAGAPEQTAPREQFVQLTAQEIRRARIGRQVTIQSFDWGALRRFRQVEPSLPRIALTNRDFLQTGQPGASPWLGGVDVDDYGGSLVRAAKAIGATAISPVHGTPQNGTVNDPAYVPYVTSEMVREAHRSRMAVIPWTVDDAPTMTSLMDKGVDGLITDYPDRLRALMAQRHLRLPRPELTRRDCVAAARGGDQDVTAMTYNIHHGADHAEQLDLERIAREVEGSGADVVALQEVDNHWGERSGGADQTAELADRLGMHAVYGANLDLDPPAAGQPRRQYGTAILSRFPIRSSRNTLLPRPAGGEQRGLLEAVVKVNGRPLRVANTHLQHNNADERLAQALKMDELLGAAKEPTVLMGDLNATPDQPELAPLWGRFDDAWLRAGTGDGFTYPVEAPDRRIDYILASKCGLDVERAAVRSGQGSDHLPVTAEVEVRRC
jgi:glycerophosphoryl diester phosphodiesterase